MAESKESRAKKNGCGITVGRDAMHRVSTVIHILLYNGPDNHQSFLFCLDSWLLILDSYTNIKMELITTDICIIGAGPVGLFCGF